ncbi:hypothetical protein NDU88_005645, partial [Pleurodeles waltl]
ARFRVSPLTWRKGLLLTVPIPCCPLRGPLLVGGCRTPEGRAGGGKPHPLALVQPEGTDPRLADQLQVNSPALVEELCRTASTST